MQVRELWYVASHFDGLSLRRSCSSLAKCVSYAHNTGPPDTDNKTLTNRDNNDFGLCNPSQIVFSRSSLTFTGPGLVFFIFFLFTHEFLE